MTSRKPATCCGVNALDREIGREWLAYCRALLRGEHPAEPDRRQLPFPDPEEERR